MALTVQFLFILVASPLLCLPAWHVARKARRWYGWDYATALGPIPFWFVLMSMRVGHMSMANLIVELLAVAAFVPAAISLRVFLLDQYVRDSRRSSIIVCALCFALPLALRLAVPGIPE
jgi:hypothetical protein